ncbi:MAG: serine/threonine-protein kinase [Polyangiaceae bacterium]
MSTCSTRPVACPSESEIDAYWRGTLPPQARQSVAIHLDGCVECTALVAAIGRVLSSPNAPTPLSASAAPSMVGSGALAPTRIGRFTVDGVLGVGGYGTVFRGRDPDLGRAVAIKVVRLDRAGAGARHAELQARLLDEARTTAQLSHPNVVPIYEVGATEDGVFIVMELAPLGSLRAWLAERRSPQEILAVYRQVGEALVAAHALGIVHRDVKPDNVVMGAGRARITDFGLALLTDLDSASRGSMLAVGTPAYAAPEQVFGGPVDARADQFALAVCLYEALYGAPPFQRGSLQAMQWVYASSAAQVPPRSTNVPEAIAHVLMKALSVRPQLRFRDTRTFLAALESAEHADDQLHVQAHIALQAAAPVGHLVVIGLFASKWGETTREPATSASRPSTSVRAMGSTSTVPSGSADVASSPPPADPPSHATDIMLGGVVVVAILVLTAWLFLGLVWAPVNAWGLYTRRRFARTSTLVYACVSGLTCCGLLYAVYALWSLRRPGVKAMFGARIRD